MRLLPALLLVLGLTATAAPLPFPRTHPALKGLEGEWALSSITTRVGGVGGALTGGGLRAALLTFSVKGDRLRLSHRDKLIGEWVMAPRPERGGRGFGLILTRREGGAADGSGGYRPDEGLLLLQLVAQDAGLAGPSDPPERRKAAVHLLLTRKERR
jgi:hypothetical protein